jgi:hypothetical protein
MSHTVTPEILSPRTPADMDGKWATGQHLVIAVEDRGLKPPGSGHGKTGSVFTGSREKKTGLSPSSREGLWETGGGGWVLHNYSVPSARNLIRKQFQFDCKKKKVAAAAVPDQIKAGGTN